MSSHRRRRRHSSFGRRLHVEFVVPPLALVASPPRSFPVLTVRCGNSTVFSQRTGLCEIRVWVQHIAPEYASRGLYSHKTDVFSFGVLVLAIISGRKNTIMERQGDTVGNLVRDAWHKWKDGRLHELVDPSLGDGYELSKIMRCTQVALLCAQEDPANRPTMTDVATMLSSESIGLLLDPEQPTELVNGGASGDMSST